MTLATVQLMALRTDTVLTSRHMEILEYAWCYYQKHDVGPLYRNMAKKSGADRKEIQELFPHGINSIYNWVGIPIHTTANICKPLAKIEIKDPRQVYLDHNATTYPHPKVVKQMVNFWRDAESYGNPSGSYTPAKHAYDLIYNAREQVSRALTVAPENLYFTASGSEANNMAIKGVAFRYLQSPGRLITSAVEHSSVLKSMQFLESLGFEVIYLKPNRDGIIEANQVGQYINEQTQMVSIMAANNEIGTLNPIAEIGALCHAAGIPFMVDAVQAYTKIELHPEKMHIDLLTISGHKIYAPKGVGALYIRPELEIIPLVHGGSQEGRMRAGTENVAGIVAFGLASRLAMQEMQTEQLRLVDLREHLLNGLQQIEPELIINGTMERRLCNNLNVGFPGVDSGSLLLSLNAIGVYVSAGSACNSGSQERSHVIAALNIDTERYGIIRFSLGMNNSKDDIEYLLKHIEPILKKLRES